MTDSALPADHQPDCGGWHTSAIPCATATAWRRIAGDNVWLCWYSRSGYHQFDQPGRDAPCSYEGCTRTRGQLYDWLNDRDTSPREDVQA